MHDGLLQWDCLPEASTMMIPDPTWKTDKMVCSAWSQPGTCWARITRPEEAEPEGTMGHVCPKDRDRAHTSTLASTCAPKRACTPCRAPFPPTSGSRKRCKRAKTKSIAFAVYTVRTANTLRGSHGS